MIDDASWAEERRQEGEYRRDANDVALENQMNAKRDAIRGSWRKCAHT